MLEPNFQANLSSFPTGLILGAVSASGRASSFPSWPLGYYPSIGQAEVAQAMCKSNVDNP